MHIQGGFGRLNSATDVTRIRAIRVFGFNVVDQATLIGCLEVAICTAEGVWTVANHLALKIQPSLHFFPNCNTLAIANDTNKWFCFYVDWSLKVLFSNYCKPIILMAFSTIERLMIPWLVHPISLSGWANFSTNVTWHSSVADVLWLNMVWNCWSLVCIKTACIALIDLGPSSAYLGVNQGIKLPKST